MKYFKFIVCAVILASFINAHAAEVVNRVIAVVNDEVITQQDKDQLLGVLYAQYSQIYTGDELLQKMEEAKKDILRQMIEDKLVLSRAKALGIKVMDEEVNNKLEYVKQGFPSEEEFYKTLQTQGVTVANLKDRYRDQLMMKKVVDLEVKSRVSVLPSEISEYYEKHRDEFKQEEKYKVKNILIKASDEVSFELAKVEIDNIYNKLKQDANFDELAKEFSKGPGADKGGDLGYVKRGEMLLELEDAIFKLKPGEFSEPVRTKLGYHIFKVEDIQYSGHKSLEEAQRDIHMMLFQKKFKEKLSEWLAELKSKAYISIKQ